MILIVIVIIKKYNYVKIFFLKEPTTYYLLPKQHTIFSFVIVASLYYF